MSNNKTLEAKVADTILQRTGEITIGAKKYDIAPPSTATLILVSEAVSQLPHITVDEEKIVEESLYMAKDCRALGEIAAILILGARNIKDRVLVQKKREKRYLFGLFKREVNAEVEMIVDRKEELAREILETYSPKELNILVGGLLNKMEIGDFFGLTTFLIEINLTHQTKVGTEVTALGR